MNIYLQILLAFWLGATIVKNIYWKNRVRVLKRDNKILEDTLDEQVPVLYSATKTSKKYKQELDDANDRIYQLKGTNNKLEIENFKLKHKPLFKISDKISENEKIIKIKTERTLFIGLSRTLLPNENIDYCKYVYVVKNITTGDEREVAESDIPLKATPTPNKEEIFSIGSFE